jgi:Nucleotidyl transferase AbiEii toxin, Type IV TA system
MSPIGIAESALAAVGIVRQSTALKGFYLAGGTACAIQLGHRISVDLDFFQVAQFHADELSQQLALEGITLAAEEVSPGTVKGQLAGTAVSFFHYPYPLLSTPIEWEGIRLASLIDIGLMKITAIASRGAKKDFVDLYYILQHLGSPNVFARFSEKYPIERLDPYHYLRSLTYFEDAETEPDPRMLVLWNWEETKDYFRTIIKEWRLLPERS